MLDADRIDATAERIATDWGHHGHSTITAIITELYAELAHFPAHFNPQQRDAIITDAADTTASELTTLLDDHIYQEADQPPVTEYGWVMHTDDRHAAVVAAPRQPPHLVAHRATQRLHRRPRRRAGR
ncbi:hypothetical protein DDK07_24705 [Mycobacteroides abscessus]|nr:hypothetical protein DDK07_24705 [Mycobacteroides abscessus]RIR66393.1 hypothetical protein D2E68_25620 [Mycobacteroides abscessus]